MKKSIRLKGFRQRFLLFIMGTFLSLGAYAQQITVTGHVVDSSGEDLIGANVTVKGTSNGTITDFQGQFTLQNVDAKATLTVSYIGYHTEEIALNGRNSVNVTLQEDSKMLGEVVVIGYGSIDKKELTSAISHVSSKDFLNVSAIDPAMMIQGKVAGVSITNTGAGDPNSGASIQIRGVSSRQAGLGPLIVIDGVPGGNLHNLNPNDIESIDILKDGAASAIYGTRGSNGVVLVTTKKGTTDGKLTTTYSGYVSFDVMKDELEMLTPEQYRQYRVVLNGGTDHGYNTDWMKEITRTGFAHNHTLTLSGGNIQSNARVTVDYREANGMDIRSDRQEYGARMSFSHTSKSGLFKFTANVAPRIINRNNSDWEVFSVALVANPTTPVMNPDVPGLYMEMRNQEAGWNPVEKLKLERSYAEQKLLDWDVTAKMDIPTLFTSNPQPFMLTTQLTLAQQYNDGQDFWFRPSTSTLAINSGREGEASQGYNKNRQESLEWLLNFRMEKNNHNLGAMAGYSYQYWMNNGLNAENKDFTSDALTWDNLGDGAYNKEEGRNGMGSYRNDAKLIAFFGRVTYDYKQRYLLTASLRYEGSSKFGINNKWGYFPAVSAGWRISDEAFMQGISWIDDLKLRADYGVTGNQDFGSYQALATMGGFGDVFYNGQYYKGWAAGKNTNPDLRWEKGQNWNVGVDFALFGRLTGSINYYNRTQKDLLGDYEVPVPPYLFDKMFVNVGTMKNTGIEIELSADIIKTKDFTYTAGFVGATNNNKFIDFSNDIFQGQDYYDVCHMPSPGTPGPLQRMEKGGRVGNFFTYAYAGIDDAGNWLVWNKDNTEAIPVSEANDGDKRITGNGLPKFTASLNNTFTYKNWDLTLYFRGAFGFDIFNVHDFYYGLQSAAASSNVMTFAYSKNAEVTRGMNVLSDYFIEKGDYVKLDVLTLGYNFKPRENRFASNIRLYATGKNLLTLTRFNGVDPATYQVNGLTPGTFGGSKNYYPSATQLLVGVQIDF